MSGIHCGSRLGLQLVMRKIVMSDLMHMHVCFEQTCEKHMHVRFEQICGKLCCSTGL